MSLSSHKSASTLRPSSAKPLSSPFKPQSSDLFAEFETFRAQVKKEYNERMLQSRNSTLQADIFKLSSAQKPLTGYSTLPLRGVNKENIASRNNLKENMSINSAIGSSIEPSYSKTNAQIENLKRNLKEMSAKKAEKSKESLINTLQIRGKENSSFRGSVDAKKPSDFKSLLSSFDQRKGKNTGNLDISNYRFGTSGALAELENRAKMMIPSPTKRIVQDSLLSSFESSGKKPTKLEFSADSKLFSAKSDEKRLINKVMELQDLIIDLNEQDFNGFSSQLFEELIKLSSVVMTRVKKSAYYKSKYQ